MHKNARLQNTTAGPRLGVEERGHAAEAGRAEASRAAICGLQQGWS